MSYFHRVESGRDYVLEQSDGRYVAREARSFDMIGGVRIFTRAEVDHLVAIGASVTYEAIPPRVTVSGIPTWLAIVLGLLGIGATAYAASRSR